MSKLHITVIIATLGRPNEARQVVDRLLQQTRPPDRIIVSLTCEADFNSAESEVEIVIGPKGSCAQRNTALEMIGPGDGLVAFLDDDYVPSYFLIERMLEFFKLNPSVIGADGKLIADGVKGPGISQDEALKLVAAYDSSPAEKLICHRLFGLYGCNMAFRAESVRNVRFDEQLPLYGWQEDIDFAARVSKKGVLLHTNAWAGVHRGVKSGRTSGLRFGYSQVANPLYLVKKGTMQARGAYALLIKNLLANFLRFAWPEPWIDRSGRIKGNWLAIADLCRGKLRPDRILDLP